MRSSWGPQTPQAERMHVRCAMFFTLPFIWQFLQQWLGHLLSSPILETASVCTWGVSSQISHFHQSLSLQSLSTVASYGFKIQIQSPLLSCLKPFSSCITKSSSDSCLPHAAWNIYPTQVRTFSHSPLQCCFCPDLLSFTPQNRQHLGLLFCL